MLHPLPSCQLSCGNPTTFQILSIFLGITIWPSFVLKSPLDSTLNPVFSHLSGQLSTHLLNNGISFQEELPCHLLRGLRVKNFVYMHWLTENRGKGIDIHTREPCASLPSPQGPLSRPVPSFSYAAIPSSYLVFLCSLKLTPPILSVWVLSLLCLAG